ncbi:MAG: hypothetical protein FGF52_05645 [Candidatus Brockarchaeota archaeon]|nr:hypothetical protein [Candidatus Brockarchaeota archaeon]
MDKAFTEITVYDVSFLPTAIKKGLTVETDTSNLERGKEEKEDIVI